MSYEIDVASVTAVLLADGWHRVKSRSFGIEPYGYVAGAPDPAAKGNGGEGKEGKADGKGKREGATPPPVADKGLTPTPGARRTKPNGRAIPRPRGSRI